MLNNTTGELIYFVPPADGSRAFINVNADPVTGRRDKNSTEEVHSVQVEDVRGKESSFSLDTTGFQYHKRAAKHTAFTDDAEIEKEYYPESIDVIKELTRATRVVIFDHSKRSRLHTEFC